MQLKVSLRAARQPICPSSQGCSLWVPPCWAPFVMPTLTSATRTPERPRESSPGRPGLTMVRCIETVLWTSWRKKRVVCGTAFKKQLPGLFPGSGTWPVTTHPAAMALNPCFFLDGNPIPPFCSWEPLGKSWEVCAKGGCQVDDPWLLWEHFLCVPGRPPNSMKTMGALCATSVTLVNAWER